LLLVFIIIGIGLLLTQKIWVPKLVDEILSTKTPFVIIKSDEPKKSESVQLDTPQPNQIIKVH